jgi:DNA-binding transcriptional LysR family regulator
MSENFEEPGLPGLISQLKKLWMLDLVVRCGSFQKAALQAKVTRSAISQTVSSLERRHGKSLLIRGRGGVSATPFCLEILDQARPVLGSLHSLYPAAAGGDAVPRLKWLDLGAFESLAIAVLPRLLGRLEERCPGIRLRVRVERSGRLATLVRKGELCMAIVAENALLHGLTVIPLATDRLGLYVGARSPKRLHAFEAARKLPLGGLSPGPDGVPVYWERFVKGLGLPRQLAFASDSLEAVLAATEHSAIAGVLPARVAGRAGDRLVEVTPDKLREKQSGRHRICLISEKKCDPRENEFLAAEIRRLLDGGETAV